MNVARTRDREVWTRRVMVGVVVVGLLALALPAWAETVVRTGNSVSVGVNQKVENDFYAAGGSVAASGEVKGDFYTVAGGVTVNGPVGADLTAVGGTVQVHAPVGDDVRIVAGETVIANDVGGDVFVFSGSLQILSSAKVAGNVYFYGGEAVIDGPVAGTVFGRAKSLAINSDVGGLDVSAVTLELQDGARVRGDIAYSSVSELARAPGATVDGKIVRGATPTASEDSGSSVPLIFFAIWLFTSLTVFLLLRPVLGSFVAIARNEAWRAGFIGLGVLVAGPLAAIVLLVTVLGAWLGFLMLLTFGFLVVLALILLPAVLGSYAMALWRRRRPLDVIAVLLGMLGIAGLSLIPVVGPLGIFVALSITLGAVVLVIYRGGRSRF